LQRLISQKKQNSVADLPDKYTKFRSVNIPPKQLHSL